LVHVLIFAIVDRALARPFQTLVLHQLPTTAMFLRLIIGAIIAILIAYLSRRFFEEKFLRITTTSKIQLAGQLQ
jgi:peptidoglycan/LPS O-acetylase OafA/YrhL